MELMLILVLITQLYFLSFVFIFICLLLIYCTLSTIFFCCKPVLCGECCSISILCLFFFELLHEVSNSVEFLVLLLLVFGSRAPFKLNGLNPELKFEPYSMEKFVI